MLHRSGCTNQKEIEGDEHREIWKKFKEKLMPLATSIIEANEQKKEVGIMKDMMRMMTEALKIVAENQKNRGSNKPARLVKPEKVPT